MPLTTRNAAHGIAPRVRAPARKQKSSQSKATQKQKAAKKKQKRLAVTSDEDDDDENSDECTRELTRTRTCEYFNSKSGTRTRANLFPQVTCTRESSTHELQVHPPSLYQKWQ